MPGRVATNAASIGGSLLRETRGFAPAVNVKIAGATRNCVFGTATAARISGLMLRPRLDANIFERASRDGVPESIFHTPTRALRNAIAQFSIVEQFNDGRSKACPNVTQPGATKRVTVAWPISQFDDRVRGKATLTDE